MKRWWTYWGTQWVAGIICIALNAISYLTMGLVFCRVKIEGKENLRAVNSPLIIAPNHKSYYDHFFILFAVLLYAPRLLPIRAVAANWLFQKPILRFLLQNLFGAYRLRKEGSLDVSLRDALKVLRRGLTVAIYPEGRLVPEKRVGEFKKGAAYLAETTGTAILPVALRGLEHTTFLSLLFGRRTITVVCGTPFSAKPEKSREEITAELQTKIEALYYQKSASDCNVRCRIGKN